MIIWVVVFLLLIFGINTVSSLYIPTVPVTLDVASALPDLIFSQDLKTVSPSGQFREILRLPVLALAPHSGVSWQLLWSQGLGGRALGVLRKKSRLDLRGRCGL